MHLACRLDILTLFNIGTYLFRRCDDKPPYAHASYIRDHPFHANGSLHGEEKVHSD